ncbi:hypothetical protein [Eikenella corrodens]|uniref:Uncharacterized protein n=1 Tax=Eikenella corrodens TaxID=539 RepID=A0A3S9SLU6_EIKCO|nr:hypothetical protein [Eikenella corrodens]AZR60423.1 hypothetical protein ELB75_10650 [Eikenella corrodens]
MKYQYRLVAGRPDIIVRGDEDEEGNVFDCAFFNRHTRQWDYSESGYWWDECFIQANVYVYELSEQEALALIQAT